MKAFVGFAGFGGVDIALRECGFDVVGVEIDAAIAEVNRCNGGNVITADILGVSPIDFTGCFLTHFSPPCPAYSTARNSKAKQDVVSRVSDLAHHQGIVNGESELDIRFARKICEFIRVIRPQYFTLENVWGYRKSESWLLIWYALLEEGYGVDAWNLNAADYGVPQSRRRMIVIGRRDGQAPAKPFQTHSKKPDMFTKPWVGWLSAVEDLISGLSETQFAKWQMETMPKRLRTWLVGHSSTNVSLLEPETPSFTVTAQSARVRAFLLGQGNFSEPKDAASPSDTVTANNNQTGIKAFVANGQNTSNKPLTARDGGDPIFTIVANVAEKTSLPKAFIVGGQYQTPKDGTPRVVQNRSTDSPVWTVCASNNLDTRIWTRGHIVSMSPRCLARFQGFPDSFALPGDPGLEGNLILLLDSRTDRELACRGIGNAVPPGLYRAVLESLGFSIELEKRR